MLSCCQAFILAVYKDSQLQRLIKANCRGNFDWTREWTFYAPWQGDRIGLSHRTSHTRTKDWPDNLSIESANCLFVGKAGRECWDSAPPWDNWVVLLLKLRRSTAHGFQSVRHDPWTGWAHVLRIARLWKITLWSWTREVEPKHKVKGDHGKCSSFFYIKKYFI